MRWYSKVLGLILAISITTAFAQTLGPPGGSGSSGGPPTGAAGGDLSGTYPNPTVSTFNNGAAIAPVVAPTFTTSATSPRFIANAAGAVGTPAFAFGSSGIYFVSTTGMCFVDINGTCQADYGITTASTFTFNGPLTVNSGSLNVPTGNITAAATLALGWTGRGILTSPAAATVQQGAADTASPIAQSLFVQSVAAGNSNVAGTNWTLRGSLSTGSGTSGDIIFQTGGTGAAATAQNTAVAALTIKGATQHVTYGGSTPVVSACGTGTPGVDANATDSSGRITTGTVAASCTITFAKAYTTFNHCRITSQSAISGLAYSYTLSAITLTATALAGGLIDYNCDGV